MHRLLSEFGGEPERDQVQITVYEAVQSEFGRSVLAGLVFHHFFADLAESRDLGKVGNVTVHIVIDFYVSLTAMILGTQMFLAGFIGELISRDSPNRNKYKIETEL